jgi:ketosteroid isomerase-like protein
MTWDFSFRQANPGIEVSVKPGMAHLTEWLDVWEGFEVGVDELIPVADGRVVSLFWQRGKGRQSGLTMDVAWAIVMAARGGRIVRFEVYDDRAEALKAVGLED